jgi:hypothetical protein
MPKIELELELEQIAKILDELSPDELETLELLLNSELRAELKERREKGKTELKEGKTLSKTELFHEQ